MSSDRNKATDFYNILHNSDRKSKLNPLSMNSLEEPQTLSNPDSPVLFKNDDKFNHSHKARLYNSDTNYKFSKHFQLKDSYSRVMKEEIYQITLENYKELDYNYRMQIAHQKLKGIDESTQERIPFKDCKMLIRSNYPLFSEQDKKQIGLEYYLFHFLFGLSISGTALLISFFNSFLTYTNISFRSRFTRNSIIGVYSLGMIYSSVVIYKRKYIQRHMPYILKYKDKILDPRLSHLKVPYDEFYLSYDPKIKNDPASFYKRKFEKGI